jgi:hypothetical protein
LADKSKQNFCTASIALIGVSFGLGVGFAWNHVPQNQAGKDYDSCRFQNVYAPLITLAAHAFSGWFDPWSSQTTNVNLKRMLTFVKATLVFVAAWAWQALYDATFDAWFPAQTDLWTEFGRQVASAAVLSFLAIVLAVQVKQPLFVQLAAINVGWAWMDVTSTLYGAVLDKSDSDFTKVLKLWGITAGVTMIAPLIAALTHAFIGCCVEEPDEEENENSDGEGYTKMPAKREDESEVSEDSHGHSGLC